MKRSVDPIQLNLPELPRELEGLRIGHITDVHVRRAGRGHRRLGDLIAGLPVDLWFFTGDYMDHPGHEAEAARVLGHLSRSAARSASIGVLAVWGNHDRRGLRSLVGDLPLHWLMDECSVIDGLPLEILGGYDAPGGEPDGVSLALSLSEPRVVRPHGGRWTLQTNRASPPVDRVRPLRLMLCHDPSHFPLACDLKVDLMFSGHTHGGQMRLPSGRPLYNSTDLPLSLTSGVLRRHQSLAVVSRGVGETFLPLRLFCPRHLPIYTLRRGPLPGERTCATRNVRPW